MNNLSPYHLTALFRALFVTSLAHARVSPIQLISDKGARLAAMVKISGMKED